LISQIHREIQSQAKDYPLAVKTYLKQILFIMARHYQSAASDPNGHDQRLGDVERLRKVLEFLRESYQEKLTLKQISDVACMSPSYFCRFFKKVTGSSLTDYVLRMRVDRSMELLLSTDKPVTEIAYDVGFDSHSYFDRVFRRLTGLSPLEFRQGPPFKANPVQNGPLPHQPSIRSKALPESI
jgi:AraC-like DNA-binding protein